MINIVSKNVIVPNITETIYEICLFDYRHIRIRKRVYDKLNEGEYYLMIGPQKIEILERNGDVLPMLNSSIY